MKAIVLQHVKHGLHVCSCNSWTVPPSSGAGGWTWNCHHGNDNVQIHQGIQHAFANLVSRCQYSLQKNFANSAHSRGSVVSTRNKNWVIWNFFSWCHCSYSVQCRFSSLLAQKRIFAGYNIFFHFSTNLKILWKFKVVCSAPLVKAPLTLCGVQAAAVRALWVATPGNCPIVGTQSSGIHWFIVSIIVCIGIYFLIHNKYSQ